MNTRGSLLGPHQRAGRFCGAALSLSSLILYFPELWFLLLQGGRVHDLCSGIQASTFTFLFNVLYLKWVSKNCVCLLCICVCVWGGGNREKGISNKYLFCIFPCLFPHLECQFWFLKFQKCTCCIHVFVDSVSLSNEDIPE